MVSLMAALKLFSPGLTPLMLETSVLASPKSFSYASGAQMKPMMSRRSCLRSGLTSADALLMPMK